MYDPYIMRRTQIYLENGQDDEIARRARAEGLTKSAIIRRAIDVYLNGASQETTRLAHFRAAVREAAGSAPYLPRGDQYVEELRALDVERQREIESRRRR
jgi:Ribbon-helix-helix protein, copG family